MKKLLIFSFFLIFSFVNAQETDRVMINGQIIVPGGEDPEGISVINRNSLRATISDSEGRFNMRVAEGDSLVFKSLQFQDFSVIVDEGVVESRELNVYLSEAVTVLPEVVVRPYDLSGNVRVDVDMIPTADMDLPVMTAAEIDIYEWDFRPDDLTSPANAAMRTSLLRQGTDLAQIFRSIYKERKIVGRDDPDPSRPNLPNLDERLLAIYDDEFFRQNLDIKQENIHEFIFFAEDNGLTENMLEEKNELELVQFLIDQSKKYKAVKKEN